MTIQTLSAWLRCPSCFASPLDAIPPLQLRCPNGHAFDANKRGYLTALGPASTRLRGDDAAMLEARSLVHRHGFFDPVKGALAALLRAHAAANGTRPLRLLDAGCGTGHYTAAALEALPDGSRALAMDLSPVAVVQSVRGRPEVDGLVADTWQPLPIADGIVDVVLDVFAPRNAPEFRRVLADGGLLLIVVPRPEHLRELRDDGQVLDIPDGKAASLIEELTPDFRLTERHHVARVTPVDAADAALAAAIVEMGPSAHHRFDHGANAAHAVPAAVTLSVDVLAFRAD
jgi:23S rRNA (guanine745-N1)-methyltransferase